MKYRKVFWIIGILLWVPIVVNGYIHKKEQLEIISVYRDRMKETEVDIAVQCLKKARTYNERLFQIKRERVVGSEERILNEKQYHSNLNLFENGVMGMIEIPTIDLILPIYHGTQDSVLCQGVGHLYGTSLPVGGNSTHSVLNGHRGFPSAELFTRLDEIKNGDIFWIHVCGQKLTYKVVEIFVIEPNDVEKLDIVKGKDFVSLVTCTPYGINTQRLIVRGERKV